MPLTIAMSDYDHVRDFASGLVRAEGSLKIASKRVNLVNCEAELEGLVVPF